MKKETNHISPNQLQTYLDDELDQVGRQKVTLHLEQCQFCQVELSRLENLFSQLESLPALELENDLSIFVLNQLRDENKLSPGITWTLVLEALGAGIVIGFLIPAFRTAAWLPMLVDTQTEIQAAINIFLTQLASTWLGWWSGLQLNLKQNVHSLFSPTYFPNDTFSPWILTLAAAGIGLLANYILLRTYPIRSRNHKQ